jgi:hypothetical protein
MVASRLDLPPARDGLVQREPGTWDQDVLARVRQGWCELSIDNSIYRTTGGSRLEMDQGVEHMHKPLGGRHPQQQDQHNILLMAISMALEQPLVMITS